MNYVSLVHENTDYELVLEAALALQQAGLIELNADGEYVIVPEKLWTVEQALLLLR